MLVEFGLETLEQRERIGGAAGKAGKNLPLMDAPDLARTGLDHDIAKRDLTVAAHGHALATAY